MALATTDFEFDPTLITRELEASVVAELLERTVTEFDEHEITMLEVIAGRPDIGHARKDIIAPLIAKGMNRVESDNKYVAFMKKMQGDELFGNVIWLTGERGGRRYWFDIADRADELNATRIADQLPDTFKQNRSLARALGLIATVEPESEPVFVNKTHAHAKPPKRKKGNGPSAYDEALAYGGDMEPRLSESTEPEVSKEIKAMVLGDQPIEDLHPDDVRQFAQAIRHGLKVAMYDPRYRDPGCSERLGKLSSQLNKYEPKDKRGRRK